MKITDIKESKRVERALEERLRFQSLSAELSALLLKTPAADIDREIELCLEKICELLSLDRAWLRWFDKEKTAARLTHSWHRGGCPSPEESLDIAEFPWLSQRILQDEMVRVSRLDDLPAEAKLERDLLRSLDTKSILFLPLTVSQSYFGAWAVSTVREEREWPDNVAKGLQVLGGIMASALARACAEKKLHDALTEVARLKDRLQAENVYLREEIRCTHGVDTIVGESEGLRRCLRLVEQVAPTDTTVSIMGETGTGKELIARAIHDLSNRKKRPLVKVNCAALPSTLIESELFGHERGAFTGADRRREGRFELADGGTLFLDEISDLPLELQGKLLRVLQEGEFERVGGTQTLHVDVRVITATNRDLERAVENNEFRADLYYRVNVFPIRVPPLRERKEDIPLLVQHFSRKHSGRVGREIESISKRMLDRLSDHAWPGNLRELENAVERALIYSKGPVLELEQPPGGPAGPPSRPQTAALPRSTLLRDVERQHVESILEAAGWTIEGKTGAAFRLGMPPSSLRSRMKRLRIERVPPRVWVE